MIIGIASGISGVWNLYPVRKAFGVRRFGALVYERDWGAKWKATKVEAGLGTTKANRVKEEDRRTAVDQEMRKTKRKSGDR